MKWLTSWLPSFNQSSRRSGKKTKSEKPQKATKLSLEPLEDRLVPRTTVSLDFGLGLPAAGLTGETFAGLTNINGPDLGKPPFLPVSVPPGENLSFERLHGITGGSVTFDTRDEIIALQNAVLPIVRRAFEPFDIDVELSQA